MSFLWVRAAHLVYQVGEPEWAGEGEHVTDYGEADKVSPESMGLLPEPTHQPRFQATDGYPKTVAVKPHTFRANQDWLYGQHVRNLATVPQHEFHHPEWAEPVEAYEMKDGSHLLIDGHHRAAASILRGDKHLWTEVTAKEV